MQGPVVEEELRRRQEARDQLRAAEAAEARRRAAQAALARAAAANGQAADDTGAHLRPLPPRPAAEPPAEDPAPPAPAAQHDETLGLRRRHQAAAAPDADAGGDEPPARFCRICHCGDEAGPLIAPCLCSGTLGLVHLACLNAWRAHSATPESLERCDVCGYAYHVQRAAWARHATDPRVAAACSALILALAVLLCGAAEAALPLGLAERFYRLVLWRPAWRLWRGWPFLSWALDQAVVGAAVVGLAGSAAAAYTWFHSDRDWFYRAVLPSALVFFSESGSPGLRLYVVGGLWLGYWTILPARSPTG